MHRSASVLATLALLLTGTAGGAIVPERGWSLSFRAENDLPANSDRYYTNGASLQFAHCVDDANAVWPGVLRLPGLDRPGFLGQAADFGQVMVTPADTQLTEPDPRDRPYSGLLYVGLGWQRLSGRGYTALKLITGVVGPAALAGPTQKAVHRLMGSPQPRGWDRQLRTEPILNAVYERRWRAGAWGRGDGWNADTLLVNGAMLGNVLAQAYGQVQVRAGWRTPPDFGTSVIRGIGALPPARDAARWGAHLFAGAGGFAVARNLTLDGNSFRSGPRVERRPLVPAGEAGAVLRGRGWQIAASWIVWGREFETQPQRAEFGALAFTVFR
jgi:lipid A 3-O-deacylase